MAKKRSYRTFIILTVQLIRNNNFRLGLMDGDYENIFRQPLQVKTVEVKDKLDLIASISNRAILTYRKHGKLVNPSISEWITSNHLHQTQKRNSAKIVFEFKVQGDKHIYTLYTNQMNLICNKS